MPKYLSFSLTADAVITSLLLICPMSADRIGMFSFFSISEIASIEPIVSHLRIIPLESVLISADFTSDSTDFLSHFLRRQ